MNIVIKTIIFIIAICLGVFYALDKNPNQQEGKISESKVSLEQEEKTEGESEDSKLALPNNKPPKIHKTSSPRMLRDILKFSSLNPEPPTSPPNS